MRQLHRLEIPEQLRGPWEHALIFSYGMDLSFFERALWPQFATRCHNKMILVDGRQFLRTSEVYSQQKGLLRHLNQSYVAAGIFGLQSHASAHAKLILLTNAEQGLLLVGSGNLCWQGYASGGEMFTAYEYAPSSPQTLPAFLAVRELLETLIQRGYIEGTVVRHISYLWEQTPWIFQAPTSTERPVRHNLTSSFLDQLLLTVAGEPVEELWILSPFFDKEATALKRLLQALHPDQVTLLLQRKHASVDPSALLRVLDRASVRWEIRPCWGEDENTYLHAKCYLLKLKDRTICLQGSPNLSQAAMLLTTPHGNLEVANLLVGPRDAFNYLLENLHIDSPVSNPASLELSYLPDDELNNVEEASWQLIGGERNGARLLLSFRGVLPNLQGAALVIAEQRFPLKLTKVEAQVLELTLSGEEIGLLTQPTPLSILWVDSETTHQANPIYVCNREALELALQHTAEDDRLLAHTAELDLDDKELEELLGELKEALVIDRRSVWQLAGQPANQQDEDADDSALRIDYSQINYDSLRQHPKIQQYLHGPSSGQTYTRSRLQIILAAITSHFQQLTEGIPVTAHNHMVATPEEESEGALREEEEELEEKQKVHRTAQQRLTRLLKNFIQRFLRGMHSPDFQAIVGYEVVTHNYLIFTHILWRLLVKGWIEPLTVVDALIQSWNFFWGDGRNQGYFYQLPPDQQDRVRHLILAYHNDASSLASFYYSAEVVKKAAEGDRREMKYMFALRNIWRRLLCQPPFPLETRLIVDIQSLLAPLYPYRPPASITIVKQMITLARFDTRALFRQRLETSGRYPPDSCTFTTQSVIRHHQREPVPVNCLMIQAPHIQADLEMAIALIQEWMEAEQLDYYRIVMTDDNAPAGKMYLIYYDTEDQRGKYWVRERGGKGLACDVGTITLPGREWDASLDRLQSLAIK